MATRHVFKLFGSIGPAGSLVSLTEKICSSIYPHAYNFGDESHVESQIDRDLRSVREEYIKALFNQKNKFAKKTGQGAGEDQKAAAYEELIKLIKVFIEKTVRLEKNKYMRERIFYQRERQQVLYDEANQNYNNCNIEIEDNLVKQAKTICKPSAEDFDRYFKKEFNLMDDEAFVGSLRDRINETAAKDFYNKWRQFVEEFDAEKAKYEAAQAAGNLSDPAERETAEFYLNADEDLKAQNVNDKLFIQTGEDVEDIFSAFKIYGFEGF